MIIALWRLRFVTDGQFLRIQAFDNRPTSGAKYVIVTCFSFLLALAAIGSALASAQPDRFLLGPDKSEGSKK